MTLKSWFGFDKGPVVRMPEVDERADLDDVFAGAREAAAGAVGPDATRRDRHVVVVTPGRLLMLQPCPPAQSMPPAQVAGIETMIASSAKRNIAAIAYTELPALQTDIANAIPFLGMLTGFAYIGHSVWIFEGHASSLAAGCRDADVLIVDGAMAPLLTPDWANLAASTMRKREIYIHDRATFALRRV